MSGVQITGKIKPLNGGAFPVFEDTDGQGGYRSVLDQTGRDAVSANPLFCKEGMEVYVESNQTTYVLGADLVTWSVVGSAFKATYYVDPGWTGISSGSQANPFKTVAAAFAAGAALALTGGIVYLPPSTTVTENVVLPSTGKWELSAPSPSSTFNQTTVLNGTVTCNATAGIRHTVSNISINGAVSGDATNQTARLFIKNASLVSTMNMTASSGGTWLVLFSGDARVYQASSTVSVVGAVTAFNYLFQNTVTVSTASAFYTCLGAVITGSAGVFIYSSTFSNVTGGAGSVFYSSNLGNLTLGTGCILSSCSAGNLTLGSNTYVYNSVTGNITLATNGATVFLVGSDVVVNCVLAATTGAVTIVADGFTMQRLMARIVTISGNVSVVPANANGNALRQTLAGNGGSFTLANQFPGSLCVFEYTLTLLAQGTAGVLQLNVGYTDLTGTPQTKAILTTLNINTSAVGTEVSGSFIFSRNGAAAVTLTTSGVVTAGGLSYSLGAAVRVAGP